MTETAEHKFTNRLVDETSPYLLQHAHNPVDWYPWGEEAFERARGENKPVFLSIGYAACHWCHVMEHESFENEEIAAYLNEHYVSIKVDREERPDIDDIYMQAVQAMTGSGGWPMTVFLNNKREPFFGGTYFPPSEQYGRPGFMELIQGLNKVYREQPDKIAEAGSKLKQAISTDAISRAGSVETALSWDLIAGAVSGLKSRYDGQHGGFGQAPKFPPSMALNLLLREWKRTGEVKLLEMVELTLQKMARGGMYDQLGKGFHRYSTDDIWLAPHFEKMLYDNALLAPVYFDAYLVTGNEFYKRIGREILDYTLDVMTHPEGGFYSTQDADSEGREGKYYIFEPDEVNEVLGEEDGQLFNEFYDINPGGNWHEGHGSSILNVKVAMDDYAAHKGIEPDQWRERLDAMRLKLLEVRKKRIPPLLDDKVLTSWNGLMIGAMARGTQVTGDPKYARAAEAAVGFMRAKMEEENGDLLHTWRNGEAKIQGFLEDYAFLTVGLIELYETVFDGQYLERADQLAARMIELLHDEKVGGFYTTDGRDGTIIVRLKDFYDGATPSGNSMAVHALGRLGLLLNNPRYRELARETMAVMAPQLRQIPGAYNNMLCALDFDMAPPKEIAIVGAPESEATRSLLQSLWSQYLPSRAVAVGNDGNDGEFQIALLRDKKAIEDRPTVYVCENYVCLLPVQTGDEMLAQLNK